MTKTKKPQAPKLVVWCLDCEAPIRLCECVVGDDYRHARPRPQKEQQ